MASLTDSPMYASGIFAGFSPAQAALMKTAEVAQAILKLRLRTSIQADDTPEEDDDDSDDASVASWQTSDSAATDDIDDIFEEPPVSSSGGRQSINRHWNVFTEVEEEYSEEHTTALIADFIKVVTHYANKPVVETIVRGLMLGPKTRLQLGLKMSWMKAVGTYTWVFEKVRKDVRVLVREIRVSRAARGPLGQGYSPIGQALWEIDMGHNLGSLNPAVEVVKMQKLVLAVLKSTQSVEVEKMGEGSEQKEEEGDTGTEGEAEAGGLSM